MNESNLPREAPLVDALLDAVVQPPPDKRLFFLEGPAGAGKTTLAVRRLRALLNGGQAADSILVWVPQRVLGKPYTDALYEYDRPGGEVTVATVGGLARRTLALFWPLIAERAGFDPERDPTFLTLETAQYYMDRVLAPFIEAGYFDGLAIRRPRLASQIIDNLNKAAVVGFPHTEVGERLKRAWAGKSSQKQMYDQAQAAANTFRSYCTANNLLDFSLQLEVFFTCLLGEPVCRAYLFERYRHLIVDNLEEDTPRAHDLLKQWLGECETALLIVDWQAGYRAFLGADPEGAAEFKWACHDWLALDRSHVTSPHVAELGRELVSSLGSQVTQSLLDRPLHETEHRTIDRELPVPHSALAFEPVRFQPQMLEWVGDQVVDLVQREGVPPDEIVILAPYLGDALRFALSDVLSQRNIPVRSHRPSRALCDEPATGCLLTLAALAHPGWQYCPTPDDVAQALMVAIDGLDLVRARLLTEITFRTREGCPVFTAFEQIRSDTQQRISFVLGHRFERLRSWLADYAGAKPIDLDAFVSRCFAEVLSRPGFGFYGDLDGGQVVANLIESIRKFRRVVTSTPIAGGNRPEMVPVPGTTVQIERNAALGLEYVQMVEQGVIAATYVTSWHAEPKGAVLIAPAYTFLMVNRPVDVQFWLDVGSRGWWERLHQPLTHPYVLSRAWPEGEQWGDDHEFAARQMALGRLILGLLRRCRQRVYLGIADLGAQGYEQRGPLLQAVQRVLRQAARQSQPPGSARSPDRH
jgi:hypothetical protein